MVPVTAREAQQGAVEWGVAARSFPGEEECGDQYVVQRHAGGVLVAVVDGIGHGREAAAPARKAVDVITRHAGESLFTLLRRCDDALAGTRGAVMSLASLDARDRTLTWIGVGNVVGVLVRRDAEAYPSREHLLLRGGVVGDRLPQLHGAVVSIAAGDTLVFATDGVDPSFLDALPSSLPAQKAADLIIAKHARDSDDSLVLVVRVTDAPP
jgi:serine phosphatase RsbU (regulator of sigma subunit)